MSVLFCFIGRKRNLDIYSTLSEIASSVGAISKSRPLYEGTPIPDLLVLRKSYEKQLSLEKRKRNNTQRKV